jgi:hypothetical protein
VEFIVTFAEQMEVGLRSLSELATLPQSEMSGKLIALDVCIVERVRVKLLRHIPWLTGPASGRPCAY